MQYSTNLGMSLGQLLAQSAGGGVAFDRGQQVGADIAYKRAATDKLRGDIAANEAELNSRSDESLSKALLAGIGANSEDGLRDFNATMAGTYQPPTKPLAFTDGGTQLPAPEYVSKFPDLQQKFAGLKQMLALGDKNITNLPKIIQGDQRNAITASLGTATPQEAAVIAQRVAPFESNVNPYEAEKAAILYGLVNGKNGLDNQNALLLSQGKTRFDNTGDVGTMDLLTGLQQLNLIGKTAADENKGQAAQAYAGAKENNAQAVLATTRADNVKAGKGDGSQGATMRDMAQVRDDVRSNYNLEFPMSSLTSTRPKGAPSFEDYEKSWLKKFNIPESTYFRENGKNTSDKQPNAAYQEYLDAFNRAKGNAPLQKKITERAKQMGVVK